MQPNEVSEDTHADDVDSTGSSCGENPRSNKPLMEKRRRARINKSLNELKTMLLQALKGNQSCGHSKLEKADILEMTVRYMKKLEQHKARSSRIDPGVLNKYKAGFNECRNEVMKFLSTHEGVSVDVRTRLLDHLANCQQTLQDQEQGNFMEDEFIGISNENCWSSPNGFEDTTTQRSPSASHATELCKKAMFESHGADNITKGTSHVEGQIRIISTETHSPHHTVQNDPGCRYEDGAVEQPDGKAGAELSGVTTLMESPPRGSCANGLPNSPNNGSRVMMQAPNGHFLVMASRRIDDHAVYKQHLESNIPEKFYSASNGGALPRPPHSSPVWTSRPLYQNPKLPTIDYRQLQFSHSAVLRRANSTQDSLESSQVDLRSLEPNEPWRPWQNSQV